MLQIEFLKITINFSFFNFVPYKLKSEKCQNSIVQLPDKMKTWMIDLIFVLSSASTEWVAEKLRKAIFAMLNVYHEDPQLNLCGRDHERGTDMAGRRDWDGLVSGLQQS